MSAEDFDKTQGLIEQTNAEEDKAREALAHIQFEIMVSCSQSEWPSSTDGVKPVLAAVQKMLIAAAAGSASDFADANYAAEDAMNEWGADLFGGEKKP